jgi:DNA-cytosine methyltransferase
MNQFIKLETIELFAGAGGLGAGFLLAHHPAVQFHPLLALDVSTYATQAYKANMEWLVANAPTLLPTIPIIHEESIDALNVPAVLSQLEMQKRDLDLLLGGPPCQGFSPSNRQSKKQNRNEQNNLIKAFLDKVAVFEPKMFLIENVQGVQWTEPTEAMLVNPQQQSFLEGVEAVPSDVQEFLVRAAEALGYYVWSDIIDAADYGVPQHRMRFFLFGIRRDLVPNKEHASLTRYLQSRKVTEKVTVQRAIGDLPLLQNGQTWTDNTYHAGGDPYVETLRRDMKNGELYDHFTTNHQDNVIERFERIPEGGNWEHARDLMTNYKDIDKTHSNIYRRLVNSRPAHTISHYRKAMTIHPSQHRGLSFREACRLQSFPDWFRFHGGSDEMQQQLANAVPPLLASAVAYAIGDLWCNVCDTYQKIRVEVDR